MRWTKQGLVYRPSFLPPLFAKAAMVPTPIHVTDEDITFLVSRCDADGVARASSVTLSPSGSSWQVSRESTEPLLDIGRPGMFDDNGVVPCTCVTLPSGELLTYYVGFELCRKIRYRLFTGVAIRSDGDASFRRLQETPFLDRLDGEAYFRCGPFVLQEGDLFRMWYVAGNEWITVNGLEKPVYEIRYLETRDPLVWTGNGKVCLTLGPDDHGFARPWVMKSEKGYQMYFSRRSLACNGLFRLGYAESADGISWTRMDERLNLDVSAEGWDSLAMMYTAVVRFRERTWCFYNGNDFGREGFGAAVLEES